MCGIFGYVGFRKAVETIIEGLKKLEYRGYDSSGIAGLKDGQLLFCKEVGKIAALEKEIHKEQLQLDMGIAQTRWATHGKPSKSNAHPHYDTEHSLAIVHNGIIENYESIKTSLIKKGVQFTSETDTEVVAHLISSLYRGDILETVKTVISQIEGSYAIALIHRDYPNQIIAFANQSSLVIGVGTNEVFLSSDANAFASYTRQAIFLSKKEVAIISPTKIEIYNDSFQKVDRSPQQLNHEVGDSSKGKFDHFTLKEIWQQPQTISNALASRTSKEFGTAIFRESNFLASDLIAVKRILILACGTSLHAGYIGALMLEDKARIPVQVEISSEFRYRNPIISTDTFVIAISQSGETADTLAAMREVRAKGGKVLAITNVEGSTLNREADYTILLHAGPEIGVCSTKAFTSQITVLALLTLLMARMNPMDKAEGLAFIEALEKLPNQVQRVLDHSLDIERLAKKYANYQDVFFIGRRYMFPTSLEGALKLKEISYINANGYPAGEMKHGPIALLDEKCPVIALCANKSVIDKMISNIMEVKARGAPVLAIAEEGDDHILKIADDVIWVPETIDELACVPTTVVTQLLSYYIAKERGADIDQPKNLAKSVTVE